MRLLMTKEDMSEFESNVLRRLVGNTPTGEDLCRINRCVSTLNEAVRKVGASWRIEAYGSVASGFSTHASDLDATCVCDDPDEFQDNAEDLRWKVSPALKLAPALEIQEEVYNAKVPVLKLRFEGCLDVDLTCHNSRAIQNTALLRAYGRCSTVVLEAGRAIKLWAKAASVCGASDRYLSSYAFTLMLVYSMQANPEIQLPVLPTEAFTEGGLGEHDERVKSACEAWSRRHSNISVADVLRSFFCFYAEEFAWGQEVVAVRLGRRLSAADTEFKSLKYAWSARLHVEDPLDTRRNLQCQLGPEQEDHLLVALQLALCQLRTGGTPAGLAPLESESSAMTGMPESMLWLGGPDPDLAGGCATFASQAPEANVTMTSSVEFLVRTKTVSNGLLEKLTEQYLSSQSTDAGSVPHSPRSPSATVHTPNGADDCSCHGSDAPTESDDGTEHASRDEEQSKHVDLLLWLQPCSTLGSTCTAEGAAEHDPLTSSAQPPSHRTPLRKSAAPFVPPVSAHV